MNFRKFWVSYHDNVIYKKDSYLWLNEELKNNFKDLNLTFVTFWKLLAVKCRLENYVKRNGIPESYSTA